MGVMAECWEAWGWTVTGSGIARRQGAVANVLLYLNDEDPIVLALPRGGVPVAFEVAPHFRLRGCGARAEIGRLAQGTRSGRSGGGTQTADRLNEDVVRLWQPSTLYRGRGRERTCGIRARRDLYPAGRPPLSVSGRRSLSLTTASRPGTVKRSSKRCAT